VRPGAAAALAAILVGAFAAVSAAQTPAVLAPPGATYVGRTITVVRFDDGGAATGEAGLRDLVEIPVGQPLSLLDVRASIASLMGLGRFEDVQVDAEADGDGVALTFRLVPLRAVAGVEFEGQTGLPGRRLRRALEDRFSGPPPVGRAEAAADLLRQLLADYGYLQARVSPSVRTDDARTYLVFHVDAGPRARIGRVNLSGDAGLPEAALLRRLDVAPGGDYDRARLEARLDAYVSDLRDHGYYEAEASHHVSAAAGGSTLDLELDVEAGPLVSVRFEGDPIPADQQRELVPIQREGSVDEDLLEDSDRRIARYLHEQGFWRATVSHRRTRQADRLDVVFTVRRGDRYFVSEVEISGNRQVPDADLRPLVRIEASQPFVESQLDADASAIESFYTSRGYSQVSVRTDVVETPPAAGAGAREAFVTPRIVITEGPRTTVAAIRIEGRQALPETELRAAIASQVGDPYVVSRAVADRNALARVYLNDGYQDATVQVDREFSADETAVDLIFVVDEGRQTVVDHVIVVGNTRTSTDTILRELPIGPGDPIGLDDLIEAQRRLAALGLFRRVNVGQIGHGGAGLSDLLVTVEDAPATTLGYGGGIEAGRRLKSGAAGGPAQEYIDVSPRGFFEIGRRNLWGKNRSVNLFARVSVRRDTNPPDQPDANGLGFNEYRVVGTYREPRVAGTNADLLVNGFLEQAVRTSFNFARKGVTAEVTKQLDPIYRLSGRYAFGVTKLFDERLDQEDQLLIDRLFPQVRLSVFSSSLVRDTRDDPIDPSSGRWVALDGEFAVRTLGSEVGFAKTYAQAFAYRRLTGARRIVLALGARLGLATGFPRDVAVTDENGDPVLDDNGQPIVATVKDLPASERFFAGGDTTVRGFAIDRLGTPDTIDQKGFPIGGNGLIVLNVELRVPLWQNLGVVGFLDGGNVYARAGGINLGQLRGSMGFGLRYQSPIGPLRVDLGFKMDRRVVAGKLEPLTALHISFGQAF